MQVASDGTATLYLGTKLVEHAVDVSSAAVIRVLLDYTATIEKSVTVTTQLHDGKWTRHRLDPDGTITGIPRDTPPVRSIVGTATRTVRTSQHPKWARANVRIASRVLAALLLLAATIAALSLAE